MAFPKSFSPQVNPRLGQEEAVLILSPHADDEVLGCGGTIGRFTAEGRKVDVVYLTDGAKGFVDKPSFDLVRRRKEESETAAGRLGTRALFYFDYPDGALAEHVRKASGNLVSLLEQGGYRHVFCPWPGEAHADHRATFDVLRGCGESANEITVWLYEVWSPLPANTLFDISAYQAQKMLALEAYDSQDVLLLREKSLCLSRYRAILQTETNYAEAFFRTNLSAIRDEKSLLSLFFS